MSGMVVGEGGRSSGVLLYSDFSPHLDVHKFTFFLILLFSHIYMYICWVNIICCYSYNSECPVIVNASFAIFSTLCQINLTKCIAHAIYLTI